MHTLQSNDGTTIAYDVYGSGPALLYITGATCFRSFDPVVYDATVFAREFTVYNYDRRGRGDSDNTLPYAPEREVEDIAALIDAAGGTAFLLGHSSGAILALEATMRLGDKVSKVVLYDPAYASDETDLADFQALGDQLDTLLANSDKAGALTLFLEGIGIPQEFIEGMQHSPQWSTMTTLAPTLVYDTLLAGTLPPLERVAHITVPTHIIVGENSPPSIHSVAAQLREAIPTTTFTELAGQDHMPDPETVLPLLTDFLKG